MDKVFNARRLLLREKVASPCIVFTSGWRRPRNIPSYQYPFRSDSSALFFFGPLPPGAVGVLYNDRSILFLQKQRPESLVWAGPRTSFDQWQERTQVDEVKDLAELPAWLENQKAAEEVSYLTPACPKSVAEMHQLLGRYADLEGLDAELLRAVVELRVIHDDYGKRLITILGATWPYQYPIWSSG